MKRILIILKVIYEYSELYIDYLIIKLFKN